MLQHLLIQSAARHPDRTAAVDREASLSYRELEKASARLAEALRSRGVGPGDRVGLYLDKSLPGLIALWGVLRAGAAYVPLDVASPPRRVARIVANGELCAILSTAARWPTLAPALASAPALVAIAQSALRPLETAFAFETHGQGHAPSARTTPPDDDPERAAYILYTSGSTGQPKGVVLSHRAARSFVDWAAAATQLGPDDVVSSHAPWHFDLSVFDLFASCRAGAAVALVPAELNVFPRNLADWIAQQRITVWYSVPSLLSRLALSGKLERHDWSRLREIIFAGEVFPVDHLRRLREQIPDARYWNWYGPTETNVCTAYAVDALAPGQTAPLPIGAACANCRLVVLDEAGRVCSRGDAGELWVSGPSVMTGYQAMPEATAQALVARGEGGERMLWYGTGDIVREDDAGLLHLLGRRDGMIKSRGYRIELGEIESVLHQHPAIAEAAAVALPDAEIGHVIRAAVVARAGQSPDRSALRAFCVDRLPAYMIPLSIEVLATLPRGSTGKVDRLRLREELAPTTQRPPEALTAGPETASRSP
ncbi:MAG TPA: amino acid adenylation domain-containing protein [Casimicrobiaceae bacterium]|nr:amino acid adenylation domain-containing protein [Casimicrobiaceae bacterium]